MRKSLFALTALVTVAVAAVDSRAATVTDTWMFAQGVELESTYTTITTDNAKELLPSGWIMPASSSGKFRIISNKGENDDACMQPASRGVSYTTTLTFYAHAGTLMVKAKKGDWGPGLVRIYESDAEGSYGAQVGNQLSFSGSSYTEQTIDLVSDGYYAIGINNQGYIYSVTNTYEGTVSAETYSVSGTVKDASGNALEGVAVSISDKSATTDATGAWTVAEVPEGSYTASFSKPGFKTTTASFKVEGADVTGIETVMQQSETLFYGSISDSYTWNAIAGVTAKLTDAQGTVIGEATTDASGTYTLTALGMTPGNYILTFSKKYYKDLSYDVVYNNETRVTMGGYLSALSLSFTATVTDAEGQPVNGATVTLARQGAGNITAAEDGTTGVYTATNINAAEAADNEFTLTVTAPGYKNAEKTIKFDGENVTETIALEKAVYTFTGTVKDSASEAVLVGAIVKLTDGETALAEATTDADGAYSISIAAPAPGEYTLTVSKKYYEDAVKAVAVTAEETAYTTDIALSAAQLTLTVTVKDAEDKAVTGATVTIARQGAEAVTATEDGTTGIYTATGINAVEAADNEYTISVSADGYKGAEKAVKFDGEDVSESIVLSQTSYTFFGTVKDGETDQEVGGATIALYRGESLIGEVSTESYGYYNFIANGLKPGLYTLTVSKQYYEETKKDIEIAADSDDSFFNNFSLEAIQLTLTVTVTDADNRHVDGATVTVSGEDLAAETLTDEDGDGVYTLGGISAVKAADKTFTVSVEAEGFEAGSAQVVFDGESQRCKVELVKKVDGILNIEAAASSAAEIYTISGIRVNARDLRPGIYVMNGRKVYLR